MEKKSFYFAGRSSSGLKVLKYYPETKEIVKHGGDSSSACKILALSPDGKSVAYINTGKIIVRSIVENKIYFELERPRTLRMEFSTKGSVLAIWENYRVTKDNPQGSPNLELYNSKTGELIKGFFQKSVDLWCPQWSCDEDICCRLVSNEVHIYSDNVFSGAPTTKIVQSNLTTYALCPANKNVAIYVRGTKGQPSYVRVHAYPNVSAAVANKAFYKADRCQLFWNSPGTGLLVLTITEVSQDSYYGEQGLNFINVRAGESSMVPLGKQGSVHQVQWHPDGSQFVVTYGTMPAKTTVFNLKCEPVFDFGTGPRNCSYFNPQGNILALAGFGSLYGHVEFWDFSQKRKVSEAQMTDTTQFVWCPDGVHVLTATTSPQLRVNNGLRVWSYKGEKLAALEEESGGELFQVAWKPVLEEIPAPTVCAPLPVANRLSSNMSTGGIGAAYVPPHMRNKSASERAAMPKLHDAYEPPSNQKENTEALSKQALKNRRRREAAKAKRQCEESGDLEKDRSAQASASAPRPARAEFESTGDPDKDKRIRNVMKKLQSIDQLKDKQAQGAKLELNQIEKLKTESSLREELAKLQV